MEFRIASATESATFPDRASGRPVFYDFGGLRISSAVVLPGLTAISQDRIGDRSPDLFLSRSSHPPPAGQQVHQSQGRYRLALEANGDGWLLRCDDFGVTVTADARTLVCHCPDSARLPLLTELLVRRVLPRVCGLHQRLPIHGASLGDASGAVLVLGTSGSGKSTITAVLAMRLGWQIFSDDMSILSDDAAPLVFPAGAEVAVWPPSQRALELPAEQCRPLQDHEGKVWYAPAAGAPTLPQPLRCVILLSIGGDDGRIESTRLDGPSVAVMLLSQIVPFNPADADHIATLAARCTRMLTAVPIYALVYPRDYARLPAVADAIRGLCTDAVSFAASAGRGRTTTLTSVPS